MNRLFVLSAAVLSAALLATQDASAQRRSGGAGARTGAVAFGGASVRITGFRGAAATATSQGAHSIVTRRASIAHRGATFGHRGVARSHWDGGILGHRAVGTPGTGIRAAGIRSGHGVLGGAAHPGSGARHIGRRGHGRWWGRGIATATTGIGFYDVGYPSYGDCLAWDGYAWVNVCSGYAGYGP